MNIDPATDLLGATEVARLLHVSRQRVHQLRYSPRHRTFPQPVVELSCGPIWLRSAVESFHASWDRKSGRPGHRPGCTCGCAQGGA